MKHLFPLVLALTLLATGCTVPADGGTTEPTTAWIASPTTEPFTNPPSEHDLRPFVFPGDIDPDNPGWRKITVYPKRVSTINWGFRNDINNTGDLYVLTFSVPASWEYKRDWPEHDGYFYEGDLIRLTMPTDLTWVTSDFVLDKDTCDKIKGNIYFGPLDITPSTTDDPIEGETSRGYKYLQYSKRTERDRYYKATCTYNCFARLSDKYVVLFHTYIDENNSDTGLPTDEVQKRILDSLNFVDSTSAIIDS